MKRPSQLTDRGGQLKKNYPIGMSQEQLRVDTEYAHRPRQSSRNEIYQQSTARNDTYQKSASQNQWIRSPLTTQKRVGGGSRGPRSNTKLWKPQIQSPSSYQRVSTSASEAMQSYNKFQKSLEAKERLKQRNREEESRVSLGEEGLMGADRTTSLTKPTEDQTVHGMNTNQKSSKSKHHQKNSIIQQKYLINTSSQFTPMNKRSKIGLRGHVDNSMKSAFLQETQNEQIRQSNYSQYPDAAVTESMQPFLQSKTYFKTSTRFGPKAQFATTSGGDGPVDETIDGYVDRSMPAMSDYKNMGGTRQPSRGKSAKRGYNIAVDRESLIRDHFPADQRVKSSYTKVDGIETYSSEDSPDKLRTFSPSRYRSPQTQSKLNRHNNMVAPGEQHSKMTQSHSSKFFNPNALRAQLEGVNNTHSRHTVASHRHKMSSMSRNTRMQPSHQGQMQVYPNSSMGVRQNSQHVLPSSSSKAMRSPDLIGGSSGAQNIPQYSARNRGDYTRQGGLMTPHHEETTIGPQKSSVEHSQKSKIKRRKNSMNYLEPSRRRSAQNRHEPTDYLAEAEHQKVQLKAQRAKELKKLQATMAPKETTPKELEKVLYQLDNTYKNEFIVPTDKMLSKHIASYANSQDDAKYVFNSYMHNFLELNRDLRTDANGITTLLDNVPCVFALPEAKTECYYAFNVNFDLNARGTVKVYFECRKPVRVFVSDSIKKPNAINADKVMLPNEVPKAYTPFKQAKGDIFQGSMGRHALEKQPSIGEGQVIDKQIYITVRADEGPAHGRIHLKTDVTMAQLQHQYNEFSEKKGGQSVNSMLRTIENKYGSRSGVIRQLNVLMNESEQMRKLASFNKFAKKGPENYIRNREEKNFIEQNKLEIRKSKELVDLEKQNNKMFRKEKIRAQKLKKFKQDVREYQYKFQQANRMVIQKILKTKGNEIMMMRTEERNRVRKWVGMMYVVQICKIVDSRRKKIQKHLDKIAKEDKMARRLQGFFLKCLYKKSITNRERRKRHFIPVGDKIFKLTDPDREPQHDKILRKTRVQMMDKLVKRNIVYSCRTFVNNLSGIRKLQVTRAHSLIKEFIQRDALCQNFFSKSRIWLEKMYAVKERITRQIMRRRYKKMILREYWKAVIDRCQRLQIRNQHSALKRYQGSKLDQISDKIRDDLIQTTILMQEEKYVENLKKFNQQIKDSPNPKQRVCSRLLKYYTDEFVLNQRTYEQDIEIIRAQIDACLPLEDPTKDLKAAKKSSNVKTKKSLKGSTASSKTVTPAKNAQLSASKTAPLGDNSDLKDTPQTTSRLSLLKFEQSDLTVLRESQEGDEDEDTDSELELRLAEQKNASITQHNAESELSLEEIERRRAEAQAKYEKRKKKIEEQEFLNQLRMFALLTPSMEFIPEFRNFIAIMQQGLVTANVFVGSALPKRKIVRGSASTSNRESLKTTARRSKR